MKAKIHVTLKQGILDPQGKAIEHALDSLGFKNAGNVRVGKYMELDVNETDKAKADVAVKAMCEKLLANTIIEDIVRTHGVKRETRRLRIMKIGVVVFPGSNCDDDCQHVFKDVLGQYVEMIWHRRRCWRGWMRLFCPAGFLWRRICGPARSRILAGDGGGEGVCEEGRVGALGFCNGFQILLEAGMLPGAMLRNRSLHFICKDVSVKVENAATAFTGAFQIRSGAQDSDRPCGWKLLDGSVTPAALQSRTRKLYCTIAHRDGKETPEQIRNGSLQITLPDYQCGRQRVGVMPHPVSAGSEAVLGNDDGKLIFLSMLEALKGNRGPDEMVAGVTARACALQTLRLDRTKPLIRSAADSFPFRAVLDGTSNSPRRLVVAASVRQVRWTRASV